METEEGEDPLNPFTKQGLSQGSRSGKRKVVSKIFDFKITATETYVGFIKAELVSSNKKCCQIM